jgi:hypothetical protein
MTSREHRVRGRVHTTNVPAFLLSSLRFASAGRVACIRPKGHVSPPPLLRPRYFMSLVVIHFGTDRTYDDVAHHEILMGPRYEGLLDDIFTHTTLSSDFSLCVHRPTATDPALAPPGWDSFYKYCRRCRTCGDPSGGGDPRGAELGEERGGDDRAA